MFLGATALVVYLCLLILAPFLGVIAWSGVLAVAFHPLHRWLVRRTGHPSVSAFISSAVVVVTLVIPLLLLASLAISQFLALWSHIQQESAGEPGLPAVEPLRGAYGWAAARLGLDTAAVEAWVGRHATELARVTAEYSLAVAANLTNVVISFLFTIFAMFLLFRDGDRIVAKIPGILPFPRARSEAMLRRIQEVIHGGVYGVVVIALLQGALCGVIFWALGVPSAALWGMVTVLTSVLPLVGAAAVWVPGTVYLAATGRWVEAAILAVSGTLLISGVDNFLRPRLVGGRVGLNELVMFFALLGGLKVFGVLGILLGPVLFAVAASIFEVLGASEERGAEPQG